MSPRLIDLGAARLHDLGPARRFVGDEGFEILHRAETGRDAEPRHAVLHLRRAERGVGGAVEFVDDRPGRAGRRPQADPEASDSPGNPLSIMVGTSGRSGSRLLPHSAMARIFPSRISGSSVELVPMLSWMVPPSMSVIACMPPL